MHGRFFDELRERYRRLVSEHAIDVLCLQENEPHLGGPITVEANKRGTQAEAMCHALGGFQCVCNKEYPALATLVGSELSVQESFLIRLPRLPRLTWFERLYIRGGKANQKFAQATRVQKSGISFTIVNFHLDTAGDNTHRRSQIQAIADELLSRKLVRSISACGDTNAFTWSRAAGMLVVSDVMAPLRQAVGATIKSSNQATHYFARQREDLLTHRFLTLVGKLGLDHPLPYDVICSDWAVLRQGKVMIQESDHDLVFAELSVSA